MRTVEASSLSELGGGFTFGKPINNMKPYYQLTNEEKLALSNENFRRSIELQAIENKIPLPVTFKDLVKQPEYIGFSIPPSSVSFYEICYEGQYGGITGSGIFYKTEGEAMRALEGALVCVEEGYGAAKTRIVILQRVLGARCTYHTRQTYCIWAWS